jgi:hypothetical protein
MVHQFSKLPVRAPNALLPLLIVAAIGCSRSPQRVKAPKIDPNTAATQAMNLYDANHDGRLSEDEAAKCPGVLRSFAGYDTNKDKAIDQDEFNTHLANLLRNGTGATELGCTIHFQGRPLSGAIVVFEPEPYLGNDIQAAQGVTNNYGVAKLGMPPDMVPERLKNMKLIQYGTFKVKVTHPTISLPAKFNTDTTLGYETIPGDPTVIFTLK